MVGVIFILFYFVAQFRYWTREFLLEGCFYPLIACVFHPHSVFFFLLTIWMLYTALDLKAVVFHELTFFKYIYFFICNMWRTSVKNKLMSAIPVAKSMTLIEVNRSFIGTMTERNKHSIEQTLPLEFNNFIIFARLFINTCGEGRIVCVKQQCVWSPTNIRFHISALNSNITGFMK